MKSILITSDHIKVGFPTKYALEFLNKKLGGKMGYGGKVLGKNRNGYWLKAQVEEQEVDRQLESFYISYNTPLYGVICYDGSHYTLVFSGEFGRRQVSGCNKNLFNDYYQCPVVDFRSVADKPISDVCTDCEEAYPKEQINSCYFQRVPTFIKMIIDLSEKGVKIWADSRAITF